MKLNLTTTIAASLAFSGCTVYLPPTEEPIPSADPIVVPKASAATPRAATTVTPAKKPVAPVQSSPVSTAPSTKPEVKKNKQDVSRQGHVFYVVKPKDTVFEVMRKTGVHWKEIIDLNNLKAPSYTIFPGQNLRIK